MKNLLLLLTASIVFSCQQDEYKLDPYAFHQPPHFPPPAYNLDRNPITREGFLLGKRLFEDPTLSADSSISCSSCHVKAVAFADPQHRFSRGIADNFGSRNAPQISNLVFMNDFFWDGGVAHLDFVPTNAIESPVEMGTSLTAVVEKLRNSPSYKSLFRAAFEVDTITTALMLQAFSQYTNLLISDRSKYDDVILARNNAVFSELELKGKMVFEQQCAGCHTPPLFTNLGYANNGLDSNFIDLGRARISGNALDIGKFRIPSLRNVARTAPYMHDGRFSSLAEVIEHYQSGINTTSSTLAPELSEPLPISESDKVALIAFLHTLTDFEFIQDPRF